MFGSWPHRVTCITGRNRSCAEEVAHTRRSTRRAMTASSHAVRSNSLAAKIDYFPRLRSTSSRCGWPSGRSRCQPGPRPGVSRPPSSTTFGISIDRPRRLRRIHCQSGVLFHAPFSVDFRSPIILARRSRTSQQPTGMMRDSVARIAALKHPPPRTPRSDGRCPRGGMPGRRRRSPASSAIPGPPLAGTPALVTRGQDDRPRSRDDDPRLIPSQPPGMCRDAASRARAR